MRDGRHGRRRGRFERGDRAGAGAADGEPRSQRALSEGSRRARRRAAARRRRSTSAACSSDISFSLHAGEVLGIAGLAGRRAHRARARDRRRRSVRRGPPARRRPRSAVPRARPTRSRAASACCRRIARRRGSSPGLTVARNIALPHGRRLAPARRAVAPMRGRRWRRRSVDELRVKATPDAAGAAAERRQPAEGRARQVARRRRPHLHLRRADARRRRRRQGRDLQPDEPADRARRRHHHDLVGAAGAARHERSHPGDAPRPHSGRDRRGRRDRRARARARRSGLAS